MKKCINKLMIAILVFVTVFSMFLTMAFAETTRMKVVLDDKEVFFPDAQPYVNPDNRTMVPIRFISESMGGEVTWEGTHRLIIIEQGKYRISFKQDENTAIINDGINDTKKTFDTKVIGKNGRTYVPLRFVSETLGCSVTWDGNTTVYIRSDGAPQAIPQTKPEEKNEDQHNYYPDNIQGDPTATKILKGIPGMRYYGSDTTGSTLDLYDFSIQPPLKILEVITYKDHSNTGIVRINNATTENLVTFKKTLEILNPTYADTLYNKALTVVNSKNDIYSLKLGKFTCDVGYINPSNCNPGGVEVYIDIFD